MHCIAAAQQPVAMLQTLPSVFPRIFNCLCRWLLWEDIFILESGSDSCLTSLPHQPCWTRHWQHNKYPCCYKNRGIRWQRGLESEFVKCPWMSNFKKFKKHEIRPLPDGQMMPPNVGVFFLHFFTGFARLIVFESYFYTKWFVRVLKRISTYSNSLYTRYQP